MKKYFAWPLKFLLLGIGLLLLGGVYLLTGKPTLQAAVETHAVARHSQWLPEEWGVSHPEGITYSARRNRFFLLEKNPSEQPTGQSTVVVLDPYRGLDHAARFTFNIGDAINLAFDDEADRLILLGGSPWQFVEIQMGAAEQLATSGETRSDASRLGLLNPEGMAIDPSGKFLFILDRRANGVVRLRLDEPLASARFERFDLTVAGLRGLRGIAVNPENHHVFVAQPAANLLHELDENLQVRAQYNLAPVDLVDPLALVFAYSPDRTDDEKQVHLFVTDSNLPGVFSADEMAEARSEENPVPEENTDDGGFPFRSFLPLIAQPAETSTPEENPQLATSSVSDEALPVLFGRIVELELTTDSSGPGLVKAASPLNAASTDLVTLRLVQTIRTSLFNPPSPDPSGLAYIPASGRMLISDSEVEEMPNLYQNRNLFGFTRPNNFVFSGDVRRITHEPSGFAYNQTTAQFYLADDDVQRIYTVGLGADGALGTGDDPFTYFSTVGLGAIDPEGIDYDPAAGVIWVADGTNKEVYRIHPGANGRFDGAPVDGGDDTATHFDTRALGIFDPDGLDFDAVSGHVFITALDPNFLYEFSTSGTLLETYDLSAVGPVRLGAIQLAPASTNASVQNIWVADRGIDNNENPNENDGRIFELTRSTGTVPTPTPTPVPSGDQLIYFSSQDGGVVGGITYADEDVLTYNTRTGAYAMFFDGSDVGLTTSDVKGFERLSDGSLLLTFVDAVTLPGVGTVENRDIVRFVPSSTGNNTAGSFAWYFDGSDVKFPVESLGIDALGRLPDGRLLLSPQADALVGDNARSVRDEDLIAFSFIGSPGANITGTWSLYFDGSDVGLADGLDAEDLYGVWVDRPNRDIYLTTRGVFSVPGVSGAPADIFVCRYGTTGSTTTCTWRMFWDGSAFGFAQSMDALGVGSTTLLAAGAESGEPAVLENGFTDGIDDPNDEDVTFGGDSTELRADE